MSEESPSGHLLAIDAGKGNARSMRLNTCHSFAGIECVETTQRFSSVADVGSSSEISNHSSAVKYQNHVRSSARPEEESLAYVRNVDTRRVQQRKRDTLTHSVHSRLVPCHRSRTTKVHSTGNSTHIDRLHGTHGLCT